MGLLVSADWVVIVVGRAVVTVDFKLLVVNGVVKELVVTFHCLIIELSPFLLLKLNGGL